MTKGMKEKKTKKIIFETNEEGYELVCDSGIGVGEMFFASELLKDSAYELLEETKEQSKKMQQDEVDKKLNNE